MEQLTDTQRRLEDSMQNVKDVEKERDYLKRQLEIQLQPMPQVGVVSIFLSSFFIAARKGFEVFSPSAHF